MTLHFTGSTLIGLQQTTRFTFKKTGKKSGSWISETGVDSVFWLCMDILSLLHWKRITGFSGTVGTFDSQPHVDHWKDVPNQRKYFDWLTDVLQISELDEWYQVKSSEIREKECQSLVQKYGGSLATALFSIYPEQGWKVWKFEEVPKEFFDDLEIQKEYFELVVKKTLRIETFRDWYFIRASEVQDKLFQQILERNFGILSSALKKFYPELRWKDWKFSDLPPSF